MRTEKQIYDRIRELEGLRHGMLNRIATYDYGGVPESLLTNQREVDVQIHELLWAVDNICPKCGGEGVSCDAEYNYCEDCGHVWGIEALPMDVDMSEKSKAIAIGFADWLTTLSPSDRVSVWSKNGESKGLFTMDNEQLFEKYIKLYEKHEGNS